ncbi:maleylpyruvate isomerase family mycothiol-dependent enzyme [Williamsia deligens]|uniref:Maleylpyruvate isomerase family mycothiol-dependent enzyme n=1 Tax=Williamsia deligens TaxID=321325 RepID=A0ABW3G735_9NOCA|nr:maleylpyruvate isomerase family mycothiol-dependent enzyme [Williamsia deligens]MCP2192827.1 TIGR03083 family protein [Williamsia deligens]
MDDSQAFAAIADERRVLADVLDGLDEGQWATQSLCSAWDVRGVAAHLLGPTVTGIPEVIWLVLRARGDFERSNMALTDRVVRRYGDELPQMLRANADHRFTPPGGGPLAPLTDLLVHGQDIRRPLGIGRTFDPDRICAALDFLMSPAARRGFAPLRAGVRWVADDVDWASSPDDRSRPSVHGTAETVLLTLTRRVGAVDGLSGDGVGVVHTALA